MKYLHKLAIFCHLHKKNEMGENGIPGMSRVEKNEKNMGETEREERRC